MINDVIEETAAEPVEAPVTIRCMTRDDFTRLRQYERDEHLHFHYAITDVWLMRLEPGIYYPIIDTRKGPPGITLAQVMISDTIAVWIDIPETIYQTLHQAEAAASILNILTGQSKET